MVLWVCGFAFVRVKDLAPFGLSLRDQAPCPLKGVNVFVGRKAARLIPHAASLPPSAFRLFSNHDLNHRHQLLHILIHKAESI
jgi:hypothetical protein